MDRYFAKIENDTVAEVVVAEGYLALPEGEWYETFTSTEGKKFASVGDPYDRANNNYLTP